MRITSLNSNSLHRYWTRTMCYNKSTQL